MTIRNKAVCLPTLATAVCGAVLSGCDALAFPDYQGESRLTLNLRVENGASPSREPLVPALTYLDGSVLRFSAAQATGEFPAAFHLNVYEAPRGELTLLDPARAPGVRVAIEYVVAVPKRALGSPIDLAPPVVRSPQNCKDGSCDRLPGETTPSESCEGTCAPSAVQVCRGDDCDDRSKGRSPLLDPRDWGIAQEYVVLYVPDAMLPQSWPALRLGAPQGLDAGYHLAALKDPSAEALDAERACVAEAHAAVIDQFNSQTGSHLDRQVLDCVLYDAPGCTDLEVPSGAFANELRQALSQAEVDRSCLALAMDVSLADTPAHETINVRIGDITPPTWDGLSANANASLQSAAGAP